MEVNLKLPSHCFCFLNLFILGSAGSSLLCSSLVAVSWGYSLSCCARASHCCSFSWCRAQALGCRLQELWLPGSRAQAHLRWCMGLVPLRHADLPGPGIKPVSPALAGRFFTTEPLGKPQKYIVFLRKDAERKTYLSKRIIFNPYFKAQMKFFLIFFTLWIFSFLI